MKKAILTALLLWSVCTLILYVTLAIIAGWDPHKWSAGYVVMYFGVECIIWIGAIGIADSQYRET